MAAPVRTKYKKSVNKIKRVDDHCYSDSDSSRDFSPLDDDDPRHPEGPIALAAAAAAAAASAAAAAAKTATAASAASGSAKKK